jgi:N-acetylglucosamine kinase-like BadF-type ATPase
MILIADSGSTKTDWRLIDANQQIYQYTTQGINPYLQSQNDIAVIFETELLPSLRSGMQSHISEIHFYGAGCGTIQKKKIVATALSQFFPSSLIEVHTDLLGAARALCGSKPGIVAILGTGSNTCYYDGLYIVENHASLGYLLGDEGSGAHIGKTLIQSYLNKELPEALAERFYQRFQLDKEQILDKLYNKPMPNRFLASFSKFIFQNLKEQYLIDLVADCFTQLFDKHILKYEHTSLKLNCVGSIAFYFSNILRAVASNKGVSMGTILETPIAGLTLYHLPEE